MEQRAQRENFVGKQKLATTIRPLVMSYVLEVFLFLLWLPVRQIYMFELDIAAGLP